MSPVYALTRNGSVYRIQAKPEGVQVKKAIPGGRKVDRVGGFLIFTPGQGLILCSRPKEKDDRTAQGAVQVGQRFESILQTSPVIGVFRLRREACAAGKEDRLQSWDDRWSRASDALILRLIARTKRFAFGAVEFDREEAAKEQGGVA